MTDSRPSEVADTDVYITRAFNAPRELVFRFFTEPEHLASWFGPAGISVPLDSVVVEPRVGGRWELVMVDNAGHGPFPMRGTIVEFVEPELIVIEVSAESGPVDLDAVTLRIEFHDHGDRTRITLHQGPFSPEMRHATETGWLESFDKIDNILAARAATETGETR
ncbi:SRPBCC domain-containing protein [Diaminobutyricibacter tongyongensis]|uniref:SRPBCC domain-containing protein n=1 Tax=Leifsonia tongyongensis TaxID=1268043 RepID=A0A6L9XXW7_9MICO|nr:SRPBCC domain-containing protein [Diaminobutyricibacter tongyongensis]NEN06057.1 SRPBCC domain-containing protein [Diaminobutyricibacter tongyongensis]